MSDPRADVAADSAGDADNATVWYPIHTVAQRTGVSVVMLRALERRYGVLCATRSAHGHRLYSELDMLRIALIAAALAEGVAPERMDAWLAGQDVASCAVNSTDNPQRSCDNNTDNPETT